MCHWVGGRELNRSQNYPPLATVFIVIIPYQARAHRWSLLWVGPFLDGFFSNKYHENGWTHLHFASIRDVGVCVLLNLNSLAFLAFSRFMRVIPVIHLPVPPPPAITTTPRQSIPPSYALFRHGSFPLRSGLRFLFRPVRKFEVSAANKQLPELKNGKSGSTFVP